ncbi:MAG: 2-polyprenyl-3-methyl-6-methoxy-1,4-benzoquinone monooxygenase [Gammaproteobacteria bacterium]|nr:2-polyprenyl-3-methyl-6-methoxy-1,4-benzoquinone monooxygenase [Gammaproteobacteria bacterium]
MQRRYTITDRLIGHADSMLQTLGTKPQPSRPSPAADMRKESLNPTEQKESVRLMRVNHTGEVCAQALYQGQSLTARSTELRNTFQQAAKEENDHLSWCADRIEEMNGKTSRLNPFFFTGAYAIGAFAGLLGDRVSAAFLAETEYQVVEHLDRHLNRLPVQDSSSRSILSQMRDDELEHAKTAEQAGTIPLPKPVKGAMRAMSKVMTGLSYWV